jgi:hypothetical protein
MWQSEGRACHSYLYLSGAPQLPKSFCVEIHAVYLVLVTVSVRTENLKYKNNVHGEKV